MIDVASQRWPSPRVPRPIVCLGAGGIVRAAHLPAYRARGLPVAGAFDVLPRKARALARDFGLPRVFRSLAEAAAEPGVVFDVAVPAGEVLPVLRGLPERAVVLIQKPLGRDLAEARRIVELCRRKRLVAAVNFQLRFAPSMLIVQRELARERLGRVVDVEVRTRTRTPWSDWSFLRGAPRLEVLYHSIHALDLLRACFGEPREVWARAERDPCFPGYADTRTLAHLSFARGVRATVVTAHSHEFGDAARSSHLLLEGTKGALLATMGVNLDYPRGAPDTLRRCPRSGAWRDVALQGSWFPDAFSGPMCNLQRFAAGEDRVLHTRVADALKTMAVVEACYRSSRRGTPVPRAAHASESLRQ